MNLCLRFLLWEFHYSKLCFCHSNWKAFTYSPWLPEKWSFQILYLIYRWILAIFFVAEIIVIGINVGTVKFFIYLSHQAFTVFVLYTVWSAVSVTAKFLHVHLFSKKKFKTWEKKMEHKLLEVPQGCCGVQTNNIHWYQKVHWLLFTLGTEMALAVTILQWLYKPATDSDTDYLTHEGAVLYIVKGVAAVMDTWFTSTPVRILHATYLALMGALYVVFHGLYFALNGTDVDGNQAIYSTLNYQSDPAVRAGISVVFVLVYLPLMHLLFFVQYLLREGLAYVVRKKCPKCCTQNAEKDLEFV